MGAIENVTALAISNILEPRFKKTHFSDAIACANAVGKKGFNGDSDGP